VGALLRAFFECLMKWISGYARGSRLASVFDMRLQEKRSPAQRMPGQCGVSAAGGAA
jgi:hypothetical protein